MPARLQISGNCSQFPLLTANDMVQVIPAAKTTLLRLDQDLLKGPIQHPFIVFTLWTTVRSHNVIKSSNAPHALLDLVRVWKERKTRCSQRQEAAPGWRSQRVLSGGITQLSVSLPCPWPRQAGLEDPRGTADSLGPTEMHTGRSWRCSEKCGTADFGWTETFVSLFSFFWLAVLDMNRSSPHCVKTKMWRNICQSEGLGRALLLSLWQGK